MKNLEKQYNGYSVTRLADGLIALYQKTLSPDHGILRSLWGTTRCRFYPSCSEYARRAIRQYGLLTGSMVLFTRIIRCNPLCQGGYDPIPAKLSEKSSSS